jgi:hypothetical protein
MLQKSLMSVCVIGFTALAAPTYAQHYQDFHSHAEQQNNRYSGSGGNKAAYERMMQSVSSRSSGASSQHDDDPAHRTIETPQMQPQQASPYGYPQPQYGQQAPSSNSGPYDSASQSGNAVAYDRMMHGDKGYVGRAATPGQMIDSEMSHEARQAHQQQMYESKERTALRGRSGLFVPQEQVQQRQQAQQDAARGHDSYYRPVNNSQTQDTTRWR